MTPDTVAIQSAIKNILFAADFSAASSRALPCALALAHRNRATVHVAHVIAPLPVYLDSYTRIDEEDTFIEAVEEAKQRLETFLRDSAIGGVQHTSVVIQGDLWECLSHLIYERKIDLVIVGTKGSTGLTKMMLGSRAEEIFREAPCPVITIGPHVSATAGTELKEILFAMELKETSLLAYPHALDFAVQNHARLTVLHVVPPAGVEFGDRGVPEYKQYMRSLVSKELAKVSDYQKYPLYPKVIVECGAVSEVILRVAREIPSDLIVMSVHHAKRLATHLPWAVAHEVVADAPCPVLTIRS